MSRRKHDAEPVVRVRRIGTAVFPPHNSLGVTIAVAPVMDFEQMNRSLFESLNAPGDLSGWPLGLAIAACQYAIVGLVILLVLAWLKGRPGDRAHLIYVALCAVLALGLNYSLGLVYPHPRPFMVGLGHTYLTHAADSSFPSDHATIMWTFVFGLLLSPALRKAAWVAALLAGLTSWARIFLGLHFPFDILGSIAVALVALAALTPLKSWIDRVLAPRCEQLHRATLGRVIRPPDVDHADPARR